METQVTTGIDLAGGEWLAVLFRNQSYFDCIVEEQFTDLWDHFPNLDLALVDVPIGLPNWLNHQRVFLAIHIDNEVSVGQLSIVINEIPVAERIFRDGHPTASVTEVSNLPNLA